MLTAMRMHRLLAEASAELLKSVFRDGRVLDHELTQAFKNNPKWGKRDRGFIAETVYEVVRWRRALAFVADSEETTALCAAQWLQVGYELPDWWSHRGCGEKEMAERRALLVDQPRAIRESVPDWLDAWALEEIGEDQWARELTALNRRAPVVLRVNRLLGNLEEAQQWLRENGVESVPVDGVEDALILPEGKLLPRPLRTDGRVEIQDAGSQAIVPMLEAQAGERIIDACSGAGGKTLQLASVMGDLGRIYAMDVEEKKLSELKKRARRARSRCIVTKPITESTPSDFEGVADRLLIDAPCSGIGTLRRQPDLKWRLKAASIDRAKSIQRKLISQYPKMLKPGGRLVYATCSILPSENREAVEGLLSEGGFSLVQERRISPAEDGCDGFYAAALIKDQ